MSTRTLSQRELPREVAEAAEELGVQAELPRVITMTQSLFPDDPWRIEIDDDPEVCDDRHLAIIAETSVGTVDELVARRWRWHEQLFECCPALLAPVFRLGTESRA